MIAPEGTVVNSRPPAATWGRTMISHLFPEIVFATMENIMPESILASNGGSPANEVYLHGRHRDGRSFLAIAQHSGGFGASARHDGYACLCFPNNTRNIPIEVTENEARMYYVRKEFRTDSGGPAATGGPRPGGRVRHPRRGHRARPRRRELGAPERAHRGRHLPGVRPSWRPERTRERPVAQRRAGRPRVYRRLAPGDRMRFVLSGGGGYGDPFARDPERVLADVEQGYVSIERAEEDYGVVIEAAAMTVDADATRRLRARRRELAE